MTVAGPIFVASPLAQSHELIGLGVRRVVASTRKPIMEDMKVTATGYDFRPAHAAMQRYVDGNLSADLFRSARR